MKLVVKILWQLLMKKQTIEKALGWWVVKEVIQKTKKKKNWLKKLKK